MPPLSDLPPVSYPLLLSPSLSLSLSYIHVLCLFSFSPSSLLCCFFFFFFFPLILLGFVEKNGSVKIIIRMTPEKLGQFKIPVLIAIAGSVEPPIQALISCTCTGPKGDRHSPNTTPTLTSSEQYPILSVILTNPNPNSTLFITLTTTLPHPYLSFHSAVGPNGGAMG